MDFVKKERPGVIGKYCWFNIYFLPWNSWPWYKITLLCIPGTTCLNALIRGAVVQYCCISNSHTLPFILQVLIFPNSLLQWTLKFIEKLNHSWLSTDRQSEHQLSCTLFLCKLTKPLQMLGFVCAYVILFFSFFFTAKWWVESVKVWKKHFSRGKVWVSRS